MKDYKNLVIGLLCAVVCIMAVAYAAFSTSLEVNGTASIESNWNVAISEITCTPSGTATANGSKTSDTLATFTFGFQKPTDSATCTVTYANTGTIAATLAHEVILVDESQAIEFDYTGVPETQALAANTGTVQVTFTATYKDVKDASGNSVSSQGESAKLVISTTATQAGL